MHKKKSATLLLLLLLVMGCIHEEVSITISETERDIDRQGQYSQDFTYESTYSGRQKVTIILSSNDPGIGLSWDNKNFRDSISMEKEVGKDFPNPGTFYFKVMDQNIPNGKYEITADISGEKGNNSNSDKLTVAIGF